MTKKEAREVLEIHLCERMLGSIKGRQITFKLPIVDADLNSPMYINEGELVIEKWTFLGLIKYIYDLEDKQIEL